MQFNVLAYLDQDAARKRPAKVAIVDGEAQIAFTTRRARCSAALPAEARRITSHRMAVDGGLSA